MSREAEIRQSLLDWVKQAARERAPKSLASDTPILEQRVITSLQIVDFIIFIEILRDAPIEVGQLKPGAFRTLDAVYDTFFAGVEV